MTDIVARLREYAKNCGGPSEEYLALLTWQAADEIERLRLRVKFLEDELKCPSALEPKP